MTMPNERLRAVDSARDFLSRLLIPRETPRVPRAIRREACAVLRHYPWRAEQIIEDAKAK